MVRHRVGQLLRVRWTLSDQGTGAPVDPAEVTLEVISPSGVRTSPTVVRDSAGIYRADVPLCARGRWLLRWEGRDPDCALEEEVRVTSSFRGAVGGCAGAETELIVSTGLVVFHFTNPFAGPGDTVESDPVALPAPDGLPFAADRAYSLAGCLQLSSNVAGLIAGNCWLEWSADGGSSWSGAASGVRPAPFSWSDAGLGQERSAIPLQTYVEVSAGTLAIQVRLHVANDGSSAGQLVAEESLASAQWTFGRAGGISGP